MSKRNKNRTVKRNKNRTVKRKRYNQKGKGFFSKKKKSLSQKSNQFRQGINQKKKSLSQGVKKTKGSLNRGAKDFVHNITDNNYINRQLIGDIGTAITAGVSSASDTVSKATNAISNISLPDVSIDVEF